MTQRRVTHPVWAGVTSREGGDCRARFVRLMDHTREATSLAAHTLCVSESENFSYRGGSGGGVPLR